MVGLVVAGAGLLMRMIPVNLKNIRFADTDMEHAFYEVVGFSQGVYEGDLGFPSGFFYVDPEKTNEPSQIRIVEAEPSGSVADGCSEYIGSFAAAGLDGGGLYGCFWFMAVAAIGSPFFIVSFLDRLYRFCLKSRIEVKLRQASSDSFADFAFYGASGYLVRKRYRLALSEPPKPLASVEESSA